MFMMDIKLRKRAIRKLDVIVMEICPIYYLPILSTVVMVMDTDENK